MGAIRVFERSYLNYKQCHETTVDVSDEAMNKWFELLVYNYHLESSINSEGRVRLMIIDPLCKHTLDEMDCDVSKHFPNHLSEFLETTKVLN